MSKQSNNTFLNDIFNTQWELALKYKDIEGMPDWPFDLDSYDHQVWIKDFLWRCTEEIAEALDVLDNDSEFEKELSDCMHFLVEVFILTGMENRVRYKDLDSMVKAINDSQIKGGLSLYQRINQACLDLVVSLGMAGNCLKNKKWKKTPIATDRVKFESHLSKAFTQLVTIYVVTGNDAQNIYDSYYAKSKINKKRQQDNY